LVFGSSNGSGEFIVVGLVASASNVVGLLGSFMLGLGMYVAVATVNLTNLALGRAVGLLLAFLGYGVLGVLLGWMIGATTACSIPLLLLRGKLRAGGGTFPTSRILDFSWPVLGYSILGLLQGWIDIVLLYALTGDLGVTGVYYFVVGGSSVLAVIWGAVSAALFPAMSSQYGRGGAEAISAALRTSIRILTLSIVPLGLLIAAAAKTLILVAVGQKFATGAPVLAVLAASSILPAYVTLYVTAIQAIGRTRPLMIIGAVAVLADAISLALLARPLGAMGAAIARIVLSATSVALAHHYLAKQVDLRGLLQKGPIVRAMLLSLVVAGPIALLEWVYPLASLELAVRAMGYLAIVIVIGLPALLLMKPIETKDTALIEAALGRPFRPVAQLLYRISRP
jgi:O-antigen/teichoic acid export membrane protein